jgi:PHD/YefM family antitoxin component YafN of YafNO toxin-antitoxin module
LEAVLPKIKPEIWTKHDGKQFVMLSLEDFERLQEMVEDAGLLRLLREARRRNAGKPTYTLAQVRERLGLTPPRKRKAK